MPIYEYCCRECGHSLEAIQKLADAPLTDCPACSRPTLKKQVSAPSFRLSGGGWYETDFKTGDKKILPARTPTMLARALLNRSRVVAQAQARRKPRPNPRRRPPVNPPRRDENRTSDHGDNDANPLLRPD